MAASPCLLLFAAIFPMVLGQELHIDVAIGETAKFPLRSFTNFDDRKMLGLALVNDTVTIELVTLAAGAPVQNAIINEKWQGRLSLIEGPDGIEAELKNFQPSDTGREVYYQYQQTFGPEGQGPKMYANIKTPPPNVPSLNVTDVGMDYFNITWPQVIPWDSATVWYYIEYRRPGVNSETWPRTANISATNATNNLATRVEGLLPAVWYEISVIASNRFGQSRSATKKALTKGSGKRSASNDVGMAVGIPVAVLVIILGIVLYVCRQRISQRCRNRKDEESGGPEIPLQAVSHANTDSPRAHGQLTGADPNEPDETDPLLDGTDGVPSGVQPPAAPATVTGQTGTETGQATHESNDLSILEPPQYHSETGIGPEVEAEPGKEPTRSGPSLFDTTCESAQPSSTEYLPDNTKGPQTSDDNKEQGKSHVKGQTNPDDSPKTVINHYHAPVHINKGPVYNAPVYNVNGDLIMGSKESGKGVATELQQTTPVTKNQEGASSSSPKHHSPKTKVNVGTTTLMSGGHAPPVNDNVTKSPLEQEMEDIFSNKSGGRADNLLELLKDVDDWALFKMCCNFISQRINVPNLNKLTAQHLKTGRIETFWCKNIPPHHSAIQTTGNGDCLFNAVSLLLTGTEDHAALLRLGAAVYAGLNVETVLKEYAADGKAADQDTALAFVDEFCEVKLTEKQRKAAPEEIIKHAIQNEARLTANVGKDSGKLQIRFLAGFVKHYIHLNCEDKREIFGYDDILTPPGPDDEHAPMLKIMLVRYNKESESPNHYVGLVRHEDEAINAQPSATSSHDILMKMVEECDLSEDEETATKFVAVVAERLEVQTMQSLFKEGHSSREVLKEVVKIWIKASGDDATAPVLKQAFADARKSSWQPSDLPSDVEVDASKDCFKAEITGQVTGPAANANDVESAALNNLSQTGASTCSSPPKGPEINIKGAVGNLQAGNNNVMNVGGARPKSSRHKRGERSTGQGKDGHRTPQNNGSYISKVNIEGPVGNMQIGDNTEMNIRPQSGPDNNMDAESTSAPAPNDAMNGSKSEAEHTLQFTGPPTNQNDVENAAFINNLSKTGQEESKTTDSQDSQDLCLHDALLLYEENDRDIDKIIEIIKWLQSWGVSLCDPYDSGQYNRMEAFEQALKKSRHAVVFLTQEVLQNIKENRKAQTTFRMSTFLCKMLNEHVQIGSQQLVPVKLAEGETPLILSNFQMLVPNTKGFKRKLFKSFTKPGGLSERQIQQKVSDIKRRCPLKKGEDGTKLVKQLAKNLHIPEEVSDTLEEFGGFRAKLIEVLDCWASRNGKEATEAALDLAIDAAIKQLQGQQNDSSTGRGSEQTNSTEAGAMTRVVKEEDFQEIQEHIGLKWKDVAKRLGLSDGQIDGIEHDHKEEPLSEKVYQMLRKWKQVKGDSATVAVLIQALEQEGLHDVADKIQIEK